MAADHSQVHWYVIARSDADLPVLVRQLESKGCRCDPSLAPIELGPGEHLLEVLGPDDLAVRLKGNDAVVSICHAVQLEPGNGDEGGC